MKTKTKTLLNIASIFLISLSITLFIIYLFYTTDLKDQKLAENRETLQFILSLIDGRVQALRIDTDIQTKQGGYPDSVYNDIVGSIADYFAVDDSQSIMIFKTENGEIVYPPSGRGLKAPEEVLSPTASLIEGKLVLPEKFGYFVNYGELGLTFFLFSKNRDVFQYRNLLLFAVTGCTAVLALIVLIINGRMFRMWHMFMDTAVRRFQNVVQGKEKTPSMLQGGFGTDEKAFIEGYNAMTTRVGEWIKKREEKLNALMKQRDNLKKIVFLYKKHIPDKTLLKLNEKNVTETVSRRQNMTSLMIELQNFLTGIDDLYPQVITDELNDFHIFLKASATKRNGLINFSNGYRINLVFGIPREDTLSYVNAVQCAKDTMRWITERNRSDRNKSGVKWTVRMGVSSGTGVTGVVGNEYLVLGDSVESSTQMLEKARDFGVYLVTDSMHDLQKAESLYFRKLDTAQSATEIGRDIYEIFLREHTMLEQAIKLYTHGLEMYYEQKYEMAVYDFKKVIKIFEEDSPSSLFLEKCEDHLR